MTKNKNLLLFATNERRILRTYLEKYYGYLLKEREKFERLYTGNPTNFAKRDREYRLELKAVELLLFKHQSQLFHNVKRPNFRKTCTIEGRHDGVCETKRYAARDHRNK